MSQGTRFHDSTYHDPASSAGPSYDFVARPKQGAVVGSGNPTFATAVRPVEPSGVLAEAFVPDKPPGLSAVQKGMVAVVLMVILAIVASIIVSFAWPAVRDYRRQGQVRATKIELPKSIAGLKKEGGTATSQVQALTAEFATPTTPVGAVYGGARSRTAVVAAGAFAMTDRAQADFLAAAADSARSHGLTLKDVDAGQRGGHLRCGHPTKTQTLCVFTDVGSYGIIAAPGGGNAGVSLATVIRQAVEVR